MIQKMTELNLLYSLTNKAWIIISAYDLTKASIPKIADIPIIFLVRDLDTLPALLREYLGELHRTAMNEYWE